MSKARDRFTTDLGVQCFSVSCSIVALAPAWLVETETGSGQAKESFQSRNKKAAQLSRVMNNILVILTGNYVTT